jgi:hypothetical protein
VSIDSFQEPTRVKVCDGMCSACGIAGASDAYFRAATSAFSASGGAS